MLWKNVGSAQAAAEQRRGNTQPCCERHCLPLGDSLGMEVLNAAQQLHEASPSVCLIVAPPLQQRVQKLSACQQLCDEVHLQGTPHEICLPGETPPECAVVNTRVLAKA